MTTLLKSRRQNRLSPFRDLLISPWENRFFDKNWSNISRFDDIFNGDFFEEDSLMPAMNVKENEKDFEVEFAAPSFNKDDFEITIEDDVLHVSGTKEIEEEEKEDDFSRKEFSYKSFRKSLLLPPSIDLDQDIKAIYENGILKINLLKKEETSVKETPKKVIEVL
ncbi:Hsp20/alpha crystallin family protein [Seonamhaeicola sediminis]|uniref:Hsp20/alpha crystallin family protein n=1 Tax=Seonamhaeicola sediminis TaxID=2528206 RepID=A0A562YEY6_9FLAO|nr:Hsp20/alpha crystallin family protein [Seonamhaeicola sediminis]TWO32893.1 Hsp20/alpha crystallin family protein [Seonamhaeicola sediminis]